MTKNYWMKTSVKHPGAMTEAAKRKGISNSEYEQEHKDDKGHEGQMARLALAFKHAKKK
jgi:hypothetical protein